MLKLTDFCMKRDSHAHGDGRVTNVTVCERAQGKLIVILRL